MKSNLPKAEFVRRLNATDANLAQACRDLDVSPSTASKWGKGVPGYALAYLVAREIMKNADRIILSHRLVMERLGDDDGDR